MLLLLRAIARVISLSTRSKSAVDVALTGAVVALVVAAVVGGVRASDRLGPAAAAPPPLGAFENEALEHTMGERAIRFRAFQQQDEHGEIPPNALLDAKAHVEAMETAARAQAARAARSPKGASAKDVENIAGISRAGWEWLGPGNIGGRIRSILIHPTTPATMWVGSVTGGIFKTTNSGATWTHLDDFMSNLAVSSLVAHPSTPNTIYAATGENVTGNLNGSGEGNRGAGVFKSTDGGTTWNQLASTSGSNWWYTNRLAVHPTSANTLLAATWAGIFRSVNGGTDWTHEHGAGAPELLQDIDFDPTNGNNAIAGGWNGRALYSINGGDTWTPATGLPTVGAGRVEVAYAAAAPTVTYASVNVNGGALYQSTDGGHSYTFAGPADGTDYLSGQGNYDNALWVSPSNFLRVIVGGVDLYQSTDGGPTMDKISDWAVNQQHVRTGAGPDSAHADHHAIVAHPSYNVGGNLTVFFGNDGGIFQTTNVTTVQETSGWQELNNNIGITQFYGAAGNTTSGKIIGGTQDNGTLRYSGATETWHMTSGGDGGYNAMDPGDALVMYGEYVYAALFRSDDGGANANYISGLTGFGAGGAFLCAKASQYEIADMCNNTANFIAPFVIDPNESDRLLVGGRSLWRTNDAKAPVTPTTGPTWSIVKPELGSLVPISAIAVDDGNPDLVYVGHNNGLIYKSTNATAVSPIWTRVDLASMPARIVLRLTIDPTNPNVVYALFGGYAGDNLWRLSDGNMNWTDHTGAGATGLPDVPARTLVVNPTNANWLYVGTEIGVFASEDGGLTWGVPHDGPANVPVDELFMMGDKLVAATYGRGVYRSSLAAAPANNALTSSQQLTGNSGTVNGTNVGATKEAGEPNHAGDDGGASVWWSWTAPATGTITVDTAGSNFDTLLALYTGSSVGALTHVASNDDDPAGETLTSKIANVDVVGGTTYRIAVDGFNAGEAPATGAITLNWSFVGAAAPPNTLMPSGPVSGSWVRPSASFSLSSDPAGASFECRVNAGAWSACTSPHTVATVVPGQFVYEFRAVGAGGADASPVVRELRVVRPFAADFDANGKANVAVWRPTNGGWYVQGSATSFFGRNGDAPVPGQWDADAAVDKAVFRPQNGGWYVEGSATVYHGQVEDVPVAAQWDADAPLDHAVWRPRNGGWYLLGIGTFYFGARGDVPVPGDYDADPAVDLAVFRPSNGGWFVQGSATVFHGQAGDIPVPADWNGDGKTDIAVYRPSTSTWFLRGISTSVFGLNGDVPVVGDFDADPAIDKVVWRPTNGGWFVEGSPTVFHGLSTDIP